MAMGINFGGKRSEKSLKDINKQLEGIMMVTNMNAGTVPAANTGQYSGPLTAIALAAGRLFRPKNKEIQAIDEQLNSIIVESEGILKEKARPAEPLAEKEPIILESVKVEKVTNYKEALPLAVETAAPEMKEMIEDVKEFATKYKGNINFTSDVKPAVPAPADDMKASMDMLANLKESEIMTVKPPAEEKADKKDPLALDGDFMARLRQSTKVEESTSSGPDIRRNMRNCRVTCDDLESDLAEISLVFKAASARPKTGRKR